MSRRIAVGFAWVAATLVSILIATAAVGSVRNNVSDTPSPLRSAAVTQVVVALPSTTTAAGEDATGSTSTPTTGLPDPTSTTSTRPTASSTTSTAAPTATTSSPPPTTTPPSTSTTAPTTTTAPPEDVITTYPQIGGTTTIRTDGSAVHLVAAVPQSGFQVDVEKSGPQEVDVRYRSEGHTSRLKAEWENGKLEVETSESNEDD